MKLEIELIVTLNTNDKDLIAQFEGQHETVVIKQIEENVDSKFHSFRVTIKGNDLWLPCSGDFHIQGMKVTE